MRGRLDLRILIIPGCFQGSHEHSVSTNSNPKGIVTVDCAQSL